MPYRKRIQADAKLTAAEHAALANLGLTMASSTGLTALGVGSGLDIKSLVQQLVTAESQPAVRLAAKEAKMQEQLSGYGQLKSALSTFDGSLRTIDTEDEFRLSKATSSDSDVLTISANASAARGSFEIAVHRTAENHRLASNTTYADTDTTTVGSDSDTLTLAVGGNAFTVGYGGKTLAAIRDAINTASDNTGVTASILTDNSGSRLYLAANEDGSDNFVAVHYSGADPFDMATVNQDRDTSGSFTAADLDAEMLVENRYTVTSSSNTVSSSIQGVTLQLVGTGTARIAVQPDQTTVEKNVQGFVDGYNKLLQTLHALAGKSLNGDQGSLSRLEARLRSELNAAMPAGSSVGSIFDLGITSKYTIGSTTGDNGQLTLDTSKLRDALNNDTDGVAAVFADSDNGIVTRLRNIVTSYLQGDGVIANKQDALDAQIKTVDDRRADMEKHLETLQDHLLSRYNALDTLLAQLQSTQNYLTQQLSSLKVGSN